MTPSIMCSLHIPKSAILMCPSESSMTLSSFRSLREAAQRQRLPTVRGARLALRLVSRVLDERPPRWHRNCKCQGRRDQKVLFFFISRA